MQLIGRKTCRLASACVGVLLLIACSRVDAPTQIANARTQIAAGRYGEAFIALKYVAQKEPDNATVRVLLAQIALAQGNTQSAETELSRITLEKIPDAEGQLVKLRVEMAAGRMDAALAALNGSKLNQNQKDNLRAVVLLGKGEIAKAIELLTPLVAADPGNIEYGTELVMALAATGDMDAAQGRLNGYLQAKPNEPELLMIKARLELASGRLATAIESLQLAVNSDRPDWPPVQRAQANFLLGDSALRNGDIAKAKSALANLSKVAPGMVGAVLLKARIAMVERRPADAVNDLQQVARAVPNDRSVPMMLAEAHLQMRNIVQAQAVLEQLIAVAPEQLDARRMLARLLLRQNRPDKVLELVDDAPTAQAADTELKDAQTAARGIQARATQTVESLQSTLAREPGNHEARLNLAVAQVSSGAASAALQSLIALPASYEPAKRLRVKLLALVAQSNRRELEREIDAVIALNPAQVDQLLTVADVTAAIGRSDLALRALDVAATAAPDNQNVTLGRASVMLIDRRLDDARKAVSALITRDPKNVRALVAMARIEMDAGDFGAARKILVETNLLDPKATEVSLALATLELRGNRVPNAVAVLEKMISNSKSNGVAAADAGSLLLSARRFAAAIPFLRKASQERSDPSDRIRLARALAENRQTGEASELLQTLVKESPGNTDAVVTLAAIETGTGQSQSAANRLSALPAEGKSRIDVLIALGDAQLAQGRAEEANRSFEQAFRSAPSMGLVLRLFAARTRANIKDPELPLKAWLARYPQDVVVRLALGDHYLRVQDNKAAIATYEEIIRAQPNQPAALNNLAWLLSEADTPRAETLARKAVQLVPNQPQIAETLASILVRQGKFADALPYFAAALAAIGNDGGALYRYATALNGAGDKAAAKSMVARALATAGAFPERPAAQDLSTALN